jgi:EKC/KEOPS complex subunit CGI121/TPRKB
MPLERLRLEHVPPPYEVYAALFRDVSNSEFLHAQLLSRNSDFEYAFVDASSVVSRLHLLSAVYNALNALVVGTLRTPNVHSEIVVSFNTSNSVTAPLKLPMARWNEVSPLQPSIALTQLSPHP